MFYNNLMDINDPEITISVSGTSARTAIPNAGSWRTVEVKNTGTVTVFVRAGDSTVTATTSHKAVIAGATVAYKIAPKHTHIAAISGGTAVTLQLGLSEGV